VRGAALASGLATLAGLALLLVAFTVRQRELAGTAPLALRRAEFLRMLRFGVPNGLNWFMEISAFTLFLNIVVSRLGTPVLAALNAILQLNGIAFMPAFGLGSAGAVLVGQAIGRGDRDDVPRLLRMTLGRAMVWMVAVGLFYLLVPHAVIRLFASGPGGEEIARVGAGMLMMSAGWQVFDAFGITVGEALRAAGDTAWCMWARLVLAWALFMPLAWYAVNVRGGGALTAIGCIIVYTALLALVLVWRFRSGAWRRIELVEAGPLA
jgi:MATE family multidrug resistance protein